MNIDYICLFTMMKSDQTPVSSEPNSYIITILFQFKKKYRLLTEIKSTKQKTYKNMAIQTQKGIILEFISLFPLTQPLFT